MTIESIAAISVGRIEMPEGISAPQEIAGGTSFSGAVGAALGELNSSLVGADASVRVMAAGGKLSTQDVMIAMESAHLKLQFAVEVRNRLVDAYQNLTNMQL
jgi:flagellar hook-basal body complex protein FliE